MAYINPTANPIEFDETGVPQLSEEWEGDKTRGNWKKVKNSETGTLEIMGYGGEESIFVSTMYMQDCSCDVVIVVGQVDSTHRVHQKHIKVEYEIGSGTYLEKADELEKEVNKWVNYTVRLYMNDTLAEYFDDDDDEETAFSNAVMRFHKQTPVNKNK